MSQSTKNPQNDMSMQQILKPALSPKAACTMFLLLGPRQANLCLRAFRHDKF